MKIERKLAFQSAQITRLESKVKELETENETLHSQLDNNKNMILLKETELMEKEKEAKNIIESFQALTDELQDLKNKYEEALRALKHRGAEYEKKAKSFISCIKKRK